MAPSIDFTELPAEVTHALEQIIAGSVAQSFESESLDFKEDPAVHEHQRNPDAKFVQMIIEQCICMVNGDAPVSHVVIGVSDRKSGSEAITGCDRDTDWIESKVFNSTKPNLTVEAFQFFFEDQPLVWIRIPRGLTLYTDTRGGATRRVEDKCRPLSEEERRAITAERHNYDYTAKPSDTEVDDIDPLAFEDALFALRNLYSIKGVADALPTSRTALLRDLGLLTTREEFTVAGKILFAEPAKNEVVIRHLWRKFPGVDPQVTEISAPLIVAFKQVQKLVRDYVSQDQTRVAVGDGQEVAIPTFPERAIDEILTNALVHRDWLVKAPVVIEQSPTLFSVRSPGGLPFGVRSDRLISASSVPRSPKLMGALRRLGYAEESSRGFDRIWASMIESGRQIPEVETDSMFFQITLSAGVVNERFVRGLQQARMNFDPQILSSVATLIVLKHLSQYPILTFAQAQAELQASKLQTRETLEQLEVTGFIVKAPGFDQWHLSQDVPKLLAPEQGDESEATSIEDWIERKLAENHAFTAAEISQVFGTQREVITSILRYLRSAGKIMIDPTGPQRGPGTRWIGVTEDDK